MRAALLGCALWAGTAGATTLLEDGPRSLSLGGYARQLAAVQRLTLEDLGRQVVGVSATVLRAEWALHLSEAVSLEVHQRGYLQIATSGMALALAGPGLGVSAPPSRTVDLTWRPIERSDLLAEHDLDRLVLRVYLDAVDLSFGRQAITWGNATLFQVADLWTTFSPLELDTSQKRGIDAARALVSIGEGAELDLVLADRGSVRNLSGGARVTVFLADLDVWAAVAKHWEDLFLFGGVTREVGAFKVRAEGALPIDLDDGAVHLPRATVGLDWFHPNVFVSVEGHFNGAGAAPGEDLLAHAASSAPLARGETYLLGRWYVGTVASWKPVEPLAFGGMVMVNVGDPSAMASLSASYAPTQAVQLTLGAFRGFGEGARLTPAPALGSELGTYGELYYLEMAAFF